MKNIIPWVLAVILAGGVYFLYGSNRSKDADISRLTEANMEMDKLRQDNEELKKLPDQQAEIERLKKDGDELLRLRSEVQKLRAQNKALSTQLAGAQATGAKAAQTAQELSEKMAQQAAEAQAQAQNATPAPADPPPVTPQDFCIVNLRLLASAKHKWASENSKAPDAVPTMSDLAPYLADKGTLTCPGGGTYELNAVQAPPTCTIEGHTLTPQ